MPVIKAPYNFVPFNKHVVSPHWIHDISHDIPFKDGLSGKIDLKLTARSPVFVRDGIGQAASKANMEGGVQQTPHEFSQYQGEYFIPATSLKGMIRSVLEILSFGSMEEKVNDHRYSVRDFHNNDLYNPSEISRQVECGWLMKVDGEYRLEHCGKPRRISHKTLSEHFGIDISQYFMRRENLGDKSARMKYEKYPQVKGTYQFETWEDKNGRLLSKPNSEGTLTGSIVFTGQPSERKPSRRDPKRWEGKHLEFVFPDRGMPPVPVPEKVIENFFFAYYDHDINNQKTDWKYWKPKLEAGEKIPVFFRKSKEGIIDMGLSMLYKITYNNSVRETIAKHQGSGRYDLSDAIFGYVGRDQSQLKGRVSIGHAFSKNAIPATTPSIEVLSGPKASYYPNYIRQKTNGDGTISSSYATFMKPESEISGWKRYPVHQDGIESNPLPEKTNSEKILTKFLPLQTGAEFTCSIHYHNLRPMELGALLSALTFHGSDGSFHSIGMGKPLGYGKLEVDILNSNELDLATRLGDFEAYMNACIPDIWNTSPQVTELLTTSQDGDDSVLSYMKLQEHSDAKKKQDKSRKPKPQEALDLYSTITGRKAAVPSYCDEAGIEKMRALITEESKSTQHHREITEVVAAERTSTKESLRQPFNEWKQSLLEQLTARRADLKEAEREAQNQEWELENEQRKKREMEAAMQAGLSLDHVNPSKRDAFDLVTKAVEEYARFRNGVNSSQLKKQFQGQYLAESDIPALQEALFAIKRNLKGARDKKKWNAPQAKNHILKKLIEWIGEDEAMKIWKNLN